MAQPAFRSGTVARMARMPVATLRIWEQRYRAVQPSTAPTGHRLYSPADVQRVLLLRQLTEQGHAIGSIAGLDAAKLQQVAEAAGRPTTRAGAIGLRAKAAVRLVVVGPALALRLQRPAVARCLARPPRVIATFDSLVEATRVGSGIRADLLFWHAPQLQPGLPTELDAVKQACRARQVGVVYRFATSVAMKALTDRGFAVIREPGDDAALGAWLASLQAGLATRGAARPETAGVRRLLDVRAADVAPRRYDDATLTAIAGSSAALACECPRHVAELLMQLSSFEAYSAGCINRSPAEAQLHAYLHQVAGASRALFESALERVARHEGLPLP